MKTHKGRGYVYSIQYHLVWCVKYRHDVLDSEKQEVLKEILEKIAKDNAFEILEYSAPGDHVHLLLDCSPQHAIPNIVKALKGTSARMMFKAFPNLKSRLWGGNLWNPSYYIGTVSENTEAQIRNYIESQTEKSDAVQKPENKTEKRETCG